jgi:hypothetical protein
MTDIYSLDAETRCLVLVGEFLRKWASMEAAMRTAMQTALGLDPFQSAIVGCPASAPMRQKRRVEEGRISGPS